MCQRELFRYWKANSLSHVAYKLSRTRNLQLGRIPVLHRPNIVTHRCGVEHVYASLSSPPIAFNPLAYDRKSAISLTYYGIERFHLKTRIILGVK